MPLRRGSLLAIVIVLLSFLFSLHDPPPLFAQLSALETEDLRLLYMKPTQSYLVPHVARCFENSMRMQRRLFGFDPEEKINIILNDFGDYGNAGAGANPRDGVAVTIAPMSYAYETYPTNERMNTLMNHELVHVMAFDKATGSDNFFRGLFAGKVSETSDHPETILYGYLTTPRTAAPRWYHEGFAVFVETWLAGGLGRAQGAYDEMVFRSMVRDGSRFYDPLGLVSEGTKVDFQVEMNSYLYGTRFMSYLAYRYSPESLIQWAARSDGSKKYFASQFKKVYGMSLNEAWSDWVAFEHEFQQANLDSIRQYPTTSYSDVSPRALGAVSRAYFDRDERKLYAALNYPGIVAHIAAIDLDDGSIEKLKDVKGPLMYSVTSLAYDSESKTIFYTTDNYDYRDILALDSHTRKTKTLLKDARIGELVYDRADSSLWGIRHYNGISTLVRIAHPYDDWKRVYSWPYGMGIYDMDISPDGRYLSAAVAEINGRNSLRIMEISSLLEGDTTAVRTFDFGNSFPSTFVYTDDGRYLYGSSYYTGVSNIFRYDVAADSMDAVSNCETGFFRPIPIGGDSLVVFRYTGKGFVPALIEAKPLEDVSAITFLGQLVAEKHPVVTRWMAGSPASIPLDSMITYSGEYKALGSVEVESIYPIAEGYKDFAAYGLRFNFSDPLSLHRANLAVSYTPTRQIPQNERLHMHLQYRRYDWRVSFKLNDADFYDLFGPTKTSRKGYSLGIGYKRTLLYDSPKTLELSVNTTGYGNLERLPAYQNVVSSFDKLLASSAELSYSNVRFSMGAVDYEKGTRWGLILSNNYVNRRAFPNGIANLDLGFSLPLHHSSVWLRTSGGYSPGDRDEPFANFFFGGFGNNYVDHADPKRYRQYYAFPGLELNELGGTNYGKAMLEWNVPPLRFRRVGRPGFYATWARMSLFSTGIVTNMDDRSLRRTLYNVGSQVDLRLTLLSHLDLTVSLGYAIAFEHSRRKGDEFMFSVKIL